MSALLPEAPSLKSTGPGAFALAGPVTFATAGALLQVGESLFGGSAAGQRAAVVDLAGVTRVDSAGLALLLEWLRQARAERREMSFAALPPKLLAIARLSGVDGLLAGNYSGAASPSPASSASSASSR